MANDSFFDPIENGYTNRRTGRTQHIIGTTRRDQFGRKLPGEYDSRGLPLDGHPEKYNQKGREYTPTDFDSFFSAGTGVDRLNKRAPMSERTAPQTRPAPTMEPGAVAANAALAAAGLPPVAVNPSQAPQINARPSTTTGGGVATRAPAPIDRAAAASAASPAPFFPDPSRRYVGPARNVNDSNFDASLATNRNIAANPSAYVTGGQPRPGATPRTAVASSNWFDAPTDDARIQRLLDTAGGITRPDPNATSSATASEIAAKYGTTPTDRLAGGRIQQNPTPGTVSYAGDGTGMPKNVAPAAVTPATTAANYSGTRFETQASPAVGVDESVAPAVAKAAPLPATASVNGKPVAAEWFTPPAPPAPAAAPMSANIPSPVRRSTPDSTYSPFESPSTAYARQQQNTPKPPPGASGAPFFGTTSPGDALAKGNLSAFGNWTGATARFAAGKVAGAMDDTGAAGSSAQQGLRRFSGVPTMPPSTPARPVAKAPETFGPPSPWWEEQQKRNRTASAY